MRYITRVWASCILFIVAASSCAQSPESLVTASLSPVATMPLNITVTTMPSITPPQVISTKAITTATSVPILPIEEAQLKFLNLLSNNNGCQLPCLWRIMPGESSFEEAQAILAPLGSIADFTAFESGIGSISPSFTHDGLELYTVIDFITNSDNETVNRILFRAEAHKLLTQGGYEDIFDSEFFGEKVSAYTLAHVLTEQGVPASVMLATFGGPLTRSGTGGFDILLLYPDQGILANYKTQMHLFGSMVRGCPTNAHIQMELYPPGKPDSFFEGLRSTDWSMRMNEYKPLEEVTSMTVQEFYDTFLQPTHKCIETPAELWPIPEP